MSTPKPNKRHNPFSVDEDQNTTRRSRSREPSDSYYNCNDTYNRPPLPAASAPIISTMGLSQARSYYTEPKPQPPPPAHPPNLGPSVLDKFGSFRRAVGKLALGVQTSCKKSNIVHRLETTCA